MRGTDAVRDLLPVAEAQARLLALATPLGAETVALADAAGRWAARDVLALRDQPAADLSAMDGYAIRFADLPGPWRVISEITPGRVAEQALGAGEAMRIFTGAPLPWGADAILIQEDGRRDGERLTLAGDAPVAGRFIRRAGGDFGGGDVLVGPGERLTPARIALAAIGGRGAVGVGGMPRIAILSTGDELVPPGAPASGVMLPASNALMLAAMLGTLPAILEDRGIVRDDFAALAAAFEAAREADIIVTTGGASVGDHDLVKPVLESLGAELDFWRIAMKPGKPLMAGKLGGAIVLGLPGNPVSAFVTATLFLVPLVAALGGSAEPLPKSRRATLGCDLPQCGARAEYLRGLWRDGAVMTVANQDSAALFSLARAEFLIVRAAGAGLAKTGDEIEIIAIA